jgi:predicted permease
MKIWSKLRSLFWKGKLDAEMVEEMRLHLEMQTEKNIAAGMDPNEARYAARRQFGGVEQIKEIARDQRGWIWLELAVRDVGYAARQLRRAPGFTAVAMLSVALGVGATTGLFSVINEVLLKPLPLPEAQRLVRFEWRGVIKQINGNFSDAVRESGDALWGATFTYLTYQRFRENNQTLEHLFAYQVIGANTVVIDGEPEALGAIEYVSGEYFAGLRVSPWRGRFLTEADDRIEAPPVGVISYAYWQKRFGGDPGAVGKTMLVNLQPVTIIGVTPPEFRGAKSFGPARNVFLPLARIVTGKTDVAAKPGDYWRFCIMGRLKLGVSVAQARANFERIFQDSVLEGSEESGGQKLNRADLPAGFPSLDLKAGSNGSGLERRESAPQLMILAGLVGLVLLMACTNVANLLLARGAARRRELAVRLALGAGRGRLVRQLLAESVLLAGGGGMLGMVFAVWGGDLLAAMLDIGHVDRVQPDWRVFGFALAVSLAASVLFGLAPALRATRVDLNAEFQGGSRTIGVRPALRLARWLVVVQVALSSVVLVGAGLFLSTLRNLRAADLGFSRDHLLLFNLAADYAGYKESAPLFDRIAAEIRRLPEVRTATFSHLAVVGGQSYYYSFTVAGQSSAVEPPPAAAINEVAPSFFEAYNLRPLRGRVVEARDDAHAPNVVVINQTMAAKYFRGVDPVGQRITFAQREAEIVGVVRDIKYGRVAEAAPATIYVPFSQRPFEWVTFAVRTTGSAESIAPAIRREVRRIDPRLPVLDLRTQDEQLERLLGERRMFARLTVAFGGVAVVLVCVGLYGLMAYAVQRRRSEIGLRMALGALPRWMLRMIVGESLRLVFSGVVLGIAASYGLTRFVASLLYGVSPSDPLTYSAVTVLLCGVAAIACWLPARRAAKVDPMVALRCE